MGLWWSMSCDHANMNGNVSKCNLSKYLIQSKFSQWDKCLLSLINYSCMCKRVVGDRYSQEIFTSISTLYQFGCVRTTSKDVVTMPAIFVHVMSQYMVRIGHPLRQWLIEWLMFIFSRLNMYKAQHNFKGVCIWNYLTQFEYFYPSFF